MYWKRIELRDLTQEEVKNASSFALAIFMPIVYKKLDKDYEMYCSYCNTYKKISYKELRTMQKERECPLCHIPTRSTTKKLSFKRNCYVNIDNAGYELEISWEWGQPLKVNNWVQIGRFDLNHFYIREHYKLNTSGYLYKDSHNVSPFFRILDNYKFNANFITFDSSDWTLRFADSLFRRKCIEDKCKFITKSNQKKLIIDNRYGMDAIRGIKVFDLKSKDEIEKYIDYFDNNEHHLKEFIRDNIELNIYYLDYLSRNNISLGDFYTYMKDIKMLGFKLDKPKDFEFRAEKVSEMVRVEKDKLIDKKIEDRYKTLPKYSQDNISISPFNSASSIRKCGKQLHNCIGGYIESYCEGKTDIYHLDLDKAIKVAIEIKNNKLLQARIDNNEDCPEDLLKHIRTFCTNNNFDLGFYREELM